MKSFIVSLIRMLVWTDLKLCLPDSESLLWIWKSRCAELIVLPWMKTFEEWSTSATGNIASGVVGGWERWNIDSSFSKKHSYAQHVQILNKPCSKFIFALNLPRFWTHVVDFLSYTQWCQREQKRPQSASAAYSIHLPYLLLLMPS